MSTFVITPIDPIISRDSRPFGAISGARVRSLDWIVPSVVCGTLRTIAGKIAGGFEGELGKLKAVNVTGPFLEKEGIIYFPRPLDFVKSDKQSYTIRPGKIKYGGTDMPIAGLLPSFIQGMKAEDEDFKPSKIPAFWSLDAMSKWLSEDEQFELNSGNCLDSPEKDERVHVSIDPESGSSEEGKLFSTKSLDFKNSEGKGDSKKISQLRIVIRAETEDARYSKIIDEISTLHPMGGERRLTEWSQIGAGNKFWIPPEGLEHKIKNSSLRMILATPAIFANGWLPGWIDEETCVGKIPGTEVKVKLVSAIVPRWEAISGWSYEVGNSGPKALRRMTPAGSVYFFDFLDGGNEIFSLKDVWLRSVCDGFQDRADGFGAAIWGAWDNTKIDGEN
ncbi:MAG: type III-B CRISPR module-associated protein Cmr3 [Treponema sp.]|jgi:CRISPR-associated protein Cmr3|nr:type III-B CRISPR module-associated protein Cmr3 [Treponema sp.]